MRIPWRKLSIFLVLVLVFSAFIGFDLGRFFSIAQLKQARHDLLAFYDANQATTIVLYMVIYITAASLSLPGALSLTFAAGAIFGPWLGTLLASCGSALGATGAFLSSRYLIGETIQRTYAGRLTSFNRGFAEGGAFYLISLRLFAVIPYFVINLLMGLTPISTRTFLWATQLGMLPVIFLYTYTGTELSEIQSVRDLLSPRLVLAFIAMAALPIVARTVLRRWRRGRRGT